MDDQGNQNSPKKQLADRLKTATNILVTVSRNPSVDQLAACIGLTLLLNKLNKHTVAVFSGEVPSTIEFLKPEETLQKNTDALRDFIIALDKDKADKLRYKVEDNVVRIFITPYKSSISQEDLEFSQGDFNVDVVVALGVKQQEDLDDSITAHGRILHDATVASLNVTADDGGLGTINWHDPQASSLSELVTDLSRLLGDKLLDNQVATALLTGIVSETARFSNDKTSSQTMSASSALMAAGANQQLVATQLEESAKQPKEVSKEDSDSGDKSKAGDEDSHDGSLNISHDEPEKEEAAEPPAAELPKPQPPEEPQPPATPEVSSGLQPGAKLVTEPPSLGGALSANTKPEALDPVTDPMSVPGMGPNKIINRSDSAAAAPAPGLTPPPASWTPPPAPAPAPKPAPEPAPTPVAGPSQTLTDLEQSVNSPHADSQKLDTARDEVQEAFRGVNAPAPTPTPIQALNAQPLGDKLHPSPVPTPMPTPLIQPTTHPTPTPTPTPLPGPAPVADSPLLPISTPSPASSVTDPTPKPSPSSLSPTPGITDSTAPPPVPPPLPSQYLNPQGEPGHQKPPPL